MARSLSHPPYPSLVSSSSSLEDSTSIDCSSDRSSDRLVFSPSSPVPVPVPVPSQLPSPSPSPSRSRSSSIPNRLVTFRQKYETLDELRFRGEKKGKKWSLDVPRTLTNGSSQRTSIASLSPSLSPTLSPSSSRSYTQNGNDITAQQQKYGTQQTLLMPPTNVHRIAGSPRKQTITKNGNYGAGAGAGAGAAIGQIMNTNMSLTLPSGSNMGINTSIGTGNNNNNSNGNNTNHAHNTMPMTYQRIIAKRASISTMTTSNNERKPIRLVHSATVSPCVSPKSLSQDAMLLRGEGTPITQQNGGYGVPTPRLSLSADVGAMSTTSSSKENIQVAIRLLPLSRNEMAGLTTAENSVNVVQGSREHYFTYDRVFDQDASQDEVYTMCKPLVEHVLHGFSATILAYGQTGTGKTHSMDGIVSRCINDVLRTNESDLTYSLSYLEIYNEKVQDLLTTDKEKPALMIREQNEQFFVEGLKKETFSTEDEFLTLIKRGMLNRMVSATAFNQNSSRSHSVLTIIVERKLDDGTIAMNAKLNLVDLAGSEKLSDQWPQRLGQETCHINLSLATLALVIGALSNNAKHIPYRNSKLTRLLRDSLGGSSRCLFIGCVNPASTCVTETLNTLRYAARVKLIKNDPVRSVDGTTEVLFLLQKEIDNLRQQLLERNAVLYTMFQRVHSQVTDEDKPLLPPMRVDIGNIEAADIQTSISFLHPSELTLEDSENIIRDPKSHPMREILLQYLNGSENSRISQPQMQNNNILNDMDTTSFYGDSELGLMTKSYENMLELFENDIQQIRESISIAKSVAMQNVSTADFSKQIDSLQCEVLQQQDEKLSLVQAASHSNSVREMLEEEMQIIRAELELSQQQTHESEKQHALAAAERALNEEKLQGKLNEYLLQLGERDEEIATLHEQLETVKGEHQKIGLQLRSNIDNLVSIQAEKDIIIDDFRKRLQLFQIDTDKLENTYSESLLTIQAKVEQLHNRNEIVNADIEQLKQRAAKFETEQFETDCHMQRLTAILLNDTSISESPRTQSLAEAEQILFEQQLDFLQKRVEDLGQLAADIHYDDTMPSLHRRFHRVVLLLIDRQREMIKKVEQLRDSRNDCNRQRKLRDECISKIQSANNIIEELQLSLDQAIESKYELVRSSDSAIARLTADLVHLSQFVQASQSESGKAGRYCTIA